MHLVDGTGSSQSLGRLTPGVANQDTSSGGSVHTTKTRSDPQGVRMCTGERPICAAKGRQTNTMALCQPPPPPPRSMPLRYGFGRRAVKMMTGAVPHVVTPNLPCPRARGKLACAGGGVVGAPRRRGGGGLAMGLL